jgi:hypothetical protein
MATKCMSCGGSTTKKMKSGGISSNKPCGPGLCRDGQGSCVNCASAKLAGVITTGISSFFANAIKGKIRKNNEAKKKVSTAKTEAAQETVQEKRIGGVTKKKYARGGTTGGYAPAQKGGDNTKNGIYGVPNAGRTDALGFKKGGITKMNDGGPKTRKNIITGRTRVTTPYAVGAPSKGTVAPKDYSTGTKTEVFGKNGNLIKTKYKHRGTGKYDTEDSKYPYNFVREEEKPGGEKKEKYPILPSFLQPADKLKKGGATKAKKFAALAPPYNKATFADRIVGAKKKVVKKKK